MKRPSLIRDCLCLALSCCACAFSLGQEAKIGGPGKPLSPAEEAKLFQLAPGLKIELVACEPQVESPVAISFDARGRLWVVEMLDYPNGPPPGKPGAGRIRILEDKDGDGVFEHSSVFAEELLFANGLLHWRDGVIVTAAPHIVWLRDTDGDGKTDKREVLYEGFAALNPQLRVSHPILGMDGWVYVANGLRGGAVKAAGKDATPISLGGMDFRFNLHTGEHEAISGMGQFGNAFDDWGNRFVCDNRHHLRHVVLENRYLKRNPDVAAPALVEDISILEDGPLSSGGKIYPLSKNWTTSNLHEGRFTAACGVFIYRGSLLPKQYHGAAFTCDPTGNLVHVETLEPHGATFKARPLFKEKEFLATPHDWCRPVFLAHGPDDALYMVDMYRAVIEHPEFMPPELKERPDLNLGKDKGRIWRIVPEKASRPKTRSLAGLSLADQVELLASSNAWERMTAHRLLAERTDKKAVSALSDVLTGTTDARAKAAAAWLLAARGALEEEQLLQLMENKSPRLQEQALLLAEAAGFKSDRVAKGIRDLAASSDARLRYQAALTLGGLASDKDMALLASTLVRGVDDRWTRLAVATSVPKQPGGLVAALLADKAYRLLPRDQRGLLLRELIALVGARQESDEVRAVLTSLRTMEGEDATALQRVGLLGLVEGVERRGGQLLKLLSKTYPKGDVEADRFWVNRLLDNALKTARDEKAGVRERTEAIQLAGNDSLLRIGERLLPLLKPSQPTEVRLAALRALGRSRDKGVAEEIVRQWKSMSPSLRREAGEILLRAPATTTVFLDAIENKTIKPAEVDPLRVRQLLKHPQAAIRDRAAKLLAAALPADRKESLEKYQASLKLAGDAKKGKAIFSKHCMTCHRVAGIGVDVAPDISDTRTKTTAALLTDIINPNQAIDANYLQYVVTTQSGRILTGILAAETASSITLKRAEGLSDVVLRSDLETIESTGLSLMPEGLERDISIEEMADLLAFLKNWRYLDGSVPMGK